MIALVRNHWRISTFRMAALFAIIIVIGNVGLLASIYWQMSYYLEHRVDKSIAGMAGNFSGTAGKDMARLVGDTLTYDSRKSDIVGLFAADGAAISGNLRTIPRDLAADGEIHRFSYTAPEQLAAAGISPNSGSGVARGLARRLPDGTLLVVGRDFTQLAEIDSIILRTLLVSGTVVLALGLSTGFALSMRSLRRINAIRDTSRRIVSGELSLRIPSSSDHDELDLLAGIVNLMLDEIERLLTEVKGVTDAVAHDLRTPLTRLRLLLQRTQSQLPADSLACTMLDEAMHETDALLVRFRAMLRISEIENLKRSAGFGMVELGDILVQLEELFEPMAEEKALIFAVQAEPAAPVEADRELLFEGFSNLVDNAIKFTPSGGSVTVRLSQSALGPRLDVIDSGCGIAPEERNSVLQRYFRGHRQRDVPGHGLGLSIVAAVMHLHGFALTFEESGTGTHVCVLCARQAEI
ncbi:MAG: HAMP domain-containing histidine kinase [Burkholderiaceae bacterium]|nr:HAMP domain-containing histidine kinase [Burkholderiaceae bacterium]